MVAMMLCFGLNHYQTFLQLLQKSTIYTNIYDFQLRPRLH